MMGGRIAALAVGRRSRWVVIAVWVVLALVLAPLQPKLQTIASDESETFFARGADSTRVDRLLDSRFPEGKDATAVIAFVSTDGQSIDVHTPAIARHRRADVRGRRQAAGPQGVDAPKGPVCGDSGHDAAPSNGPRRCRPTNRRRCCCCRSSTTATTRSRSRRDVAAIRDVPPRSGGEAARGVRDGHGGLQRRSQRGGRGAGRNAAGDHRGARGAC